MSAHLPPDLFPRLTHLLVPHVSTIDDRETLLTEAYYLTEPRLFHQIKREGSPRGFAVNCIRTLLDFGCLTGDLHALVPLLTTLCYYCGLQQQTELEQLQPVVNALCGDPTRKPAESPSTPPATPIQTAATPIDQRSPTVFISYSRSDEAFVERLKADLIAAGHACWVDTIAIKGGDEWLRAIAEGINNSYALVTVVSRAANSSKWVQREYLWAENKHKPIFPVLAEACELPIYMLERHALALYDNYAAQFQALLTALPVPVIQQPELDSEADLRETSTLSERQPNRRALELEYLDRLRFEDFNSEQYTALAGESHIAHQSPTDSFRPLVMRQEFEHLRWLRDQQQARETRRFEDAVGEMLDIRCCVLLGEPGAGKSTTLWQLAKTLYAAALADPTAPIPLLVRLGKWTQTDQSLSDFIAGELGSLGTHLDTLLTEKRAVLLLDGLNELPTSQRPQKYPQVQRFIQAHPDLMAVVSCRELDYTVDLGFDKITITPLDPLRIREFVTRYLGQSSGEALFWKLAGATATRQYEHFRAAVGDQLDNPERTFWLSRRLPAGVSWGYGKEDYTHWQNWLRNREHPSSLMVLARNPYMLLMLTSVYAKTNTLPDNRGELFREFVETLLEREHIPTAEQEPLGNGLAQVAYEMQIRRAADADGSALTVLPEDEVKAILGDRLLYLAGSASILSVGEQVRFTHQLLQEYFAARYMDMEIRAGRLQARAIWPPDKWWERTNWEEAAILLAGLYSDDPTPVVEWLMDAQPEIAAQCINHSGASTPDTTLLKLRERWLPRLTALTPSPAPSGRGVLHDPEPEARAAVGRALGQLRLSTGEPLDNRTGVGVILTSPLNPRPLFPSPQGEGPGVRFLPDIDWVEIPAGEFIYGDKSEENGPRELSLPTFHIARYPITYAQFQCFVDAPDYNDDRWWAGMPDEQEAFGTTYRTRDLSDQAFKFENHPRENVAWYQAVAFCRWLSDKLGYEVRLPTEQEWEKASRGTDGREYPYKGKFDAAKGNTRKTGIDQTSAVGIFQGGASPYGVLDMSGNVWEWCLNKFDEPDDTAVDASDARRVFRGGSWGDNYAAARAAARNRLPPDGPSALIGFRVCRP